MAGPTSSSSTGTLANGRPAMSASVSRKQSSMSLPADAKGKRPLNGSAKEARDAASDGSLLDRPVSVVTSDEINILVYAYLCESGFTHAAYNLRNEARLDKSLLFRYFHPDPDRMEFEASSSAFPHSSQNPAAFSNSSAFVPAETSAASASGKPPSRGKGKSKELGTTIPPPANPNGTQADGSMTPGAASVTQDPTSQDVPRIRRGKLIEHLQQGLMFGEIKTHCRLDGSTIECRQPFNLLLPHTCSASSIPLSTVDLLGIEDPATLFSDDEENGEPVQTARRRLDIFPPPPVRIRPVPTSRASATTPQPKKVAAAHKDDVSDEDVDMDADAPSTLTSKGKSKPKVEDDSFQIRRKPKASEGKRSNRDDVKDAPSPGASSNATSREEPKARRTKTKMADPSDDEQEQSEPVSKKRKVRRPSPDQEDTTFTERKPSGRNLTAPDEGDTPNRPSNRSRRNSTASSSVRASERGQSPPPASSKPSGNSQQKNPLLPIKNEKGIVTWKWKSQTKQVFHIVWNPVNLSRLASCSGDGTALIWDFEENNGGKDLNLLSSAPSLCNHRSVEKPKAVLDLAFSPDGNFLATVSQDGIARTFTGNGDMATINTRHTGELVTLAWSESHHYLATAGHDGTVNVWKAGYEGSGLRMSVSPHTEEVFCVDWLDSDVLASCSADHNIAVSSVSRAGSYKLVKGHTDRILMIKFSPKMGPPGTKRLLASASDDKTVRIWDVDAILSDLDATVRSQGKDAPRAEGRSTASPAVKAEDAKDDFAAGNPLLVKKLEGHEDDVVIVAWHPEVIGIGNRRLLLTASRADEHSMTEHGFVIKMFDVTSGRCLYTLTEHTDIINAIEFSPAGTRFASCSDDSIVFIVDSDTGKVVKRFDLGAGVNDVKWRKDGLQLALAMQDRTIRTLFVGDLVNHEKQILADREKAWKA